MRTASSSIPHFDLVMYVYIYKVPCLILSCSLVLCTQTAFRSADTVNWTVGGAVAGQVKSGGGLTFLAVEGAGHMVPMDQPANVRTCSYNSITCRTITIIASTLRTMTVGV